MPFSTDDTIVAIATPPGRGGIGVIRISGASAAAVAAAILDRPLDRPRYATLARVLRLEPASPTSESCRAVETRPGRAVVDEVVATRFVAPASYTGEDLVEVSGHGSPYLLEELVRLAVAAGARVAEPGEFTLRAFLHGRIDLVQAEAVADLVDSVTPLQARAAFDQLQGTLTARISALDKALTELIVSLEASIDFPEEGYHFDDAARSKDQVFAILETIDRLLQHGQCGRVVREGRQIAIVGTPNVGKSSIFNALVGSSRAIVTPLPGTTRDMVTEVVDLDGLRVTLVDTAGLRSAGDEAEAEGVRRAIQAADVADLVIVVVDVSRPLEEEDRVLLSESAGRPMLVVVNKVDLVSRAEGETRGACGHDGRPDGPEGEGTAGAGGLGELSGVEVPGRGLPAWAEAVTVRVSARTGEGLTVLRQAIERALGAGEGREVPALTNVRHLALVARAREALGRAAEALGSNPPLSEEFVLADLHEARAALEEVTGKRTSEDLLREIFGRFCIGK